MFTWICPQCGREVPPAYNECPDCSGKQAGQPAPPQQGQPQPSPPQQFQPQPPQRSTVVTAPPPVAPSPHVAYAAPPPASGISLPPWLMSIVFAILFLAVGAGAYFAIRHFSGSGQASASSPPPLESTPGSSKGKANTNTLQKYVEVVGVRLIEDAKKKTQVRFVVVNHSGAEISDLAANVNLWARTPKSDDEAIGALAFKLPSLGPYEAKEMIAPLNTKLHIYELPDWQNLTAEVQITSPQ